MTSIARNLITHRAIKNEVVLPQKPAKEQWVSRDITNRQGHDGKWREHRRIKAMSWPKSFLSSAVTSDMTPQADSHDSSARSSIPEEVEGKPIDFQKSSSTRPLFPSHSIGRLLGDCEETPVVAEKSVTCKLNQLSKASLTSKVNYKRWSVDEELSIQSNSRENDSAGKNIGYRRAKGGLRDLIRLHEEEIARASGAPKVCAKKPKHEEIRPCSSFFGFEDCHGQPVNDSRLSEIDKGKDSFIEKQQGRQVLTESSLVDPDRTELPAERGAPQQQQVEVVEKSTSTDFIDSSLPTELELKLKKQVAEKEDFIHLLLQEKENLLCKLEEQKKVANAYQKLEDRYRRKVFDLEKVLLSCRCGALESKSPSEQDLSKHLLNG